jgi:hypothetical protein
VWVPRFFTKNFQLKKLPAGVQIHVLVQGYKWLTKLPSRRVISSPEEDLKNTGLNVSLGKKWPCQHLHHFFNEFTARKKYRVPSLNFVEKKFCAKKVTKLPDLTVTAAENVLLS